MKAVAEHERPAGLHDVELLAGDVGDRRSEPPRVLEPDGASEPAPVTGSRWWRRSGPPVRPRSPPPRPPGRPARSTRRPSAPRTGSRGLAGRASGRRARRRGPRAETAAANAASARDRRRRSGSARRTRTGAGTDRRRCGARARSGSRRSSATVEDLPFVPTTWIDSNRRSGWPSAVISRRMRSSPNRIPNSSSESR